MATTTNVSNLKINILTQAQYDAAEKDENQIYLITDGVTINQLLNRSTAVNTADTNYTTLMARGSSLNSTETTPNVNGAIAWTYE